jgi:Bifunctional DNA primase/polymerase, N-terminal
MPPDMEDGPRPVTGDRPKQIAANSITRCPTGGAGAVEAARRGWAVFPCRPGDKRPAVPDWEHRACSDPERVGRHWPSGRHNIGIACGPSGLVVVDLDTHSPLPDDWRLPGVHDGRDVLALLAEWAGQPWPVTYTVKTPTGGLHLYYTAPDGPEIRNSAGKIGPLIDVRAGGGYVLAAGSVLDERAYPGNPGCRELIGDGKAYELADDSDPEPLPAWLAALAADTELAARPCSPGRVRATSGTRLQGLVSTVRSGREGDRNGPLYWAARRAAEMIAAGEVDRGTAEEALVAAAVEAGLRGGEREARRTFASAMRRGGL